MKKIMATMTIMATIAPVTTVVACSNGKQKFKHFGVLPTYAGQADQLIALGIKPDYYPFQLDAGRPYDYLVNPARYMVGKSNDFKNKFTSKVHSLVPAKQGISWWNQNALKDGEEGSDPAYWQQMEGDVLLYEHYLLDDDEKVIERSNAPKHKVETTIQTNFRASRDPYTRIPKAVLYAWDDVSSEDLRGFEQLDKEWQKTWSEKWDEAKAAELKRLGTDNAHATLDQLNAASEVAFASVPLEYSKKYTLHGETISINARTARLILSLREEGLKPRYSEDMNSWFYNDFFFVNWYHHMFLDNNDFLNSDFANWVLDSSQDSPFTTAGDRAAHQELDHQLNEIFSASTYTEEEVSNGMNFVASSNPPSSNPLVNPHHPIYEQQAGNIGAAPMFEGAMRDNILYLYTVAYQLANLANYGIVLGKEYYDLLPDVRLANNKKQGVQSKAEAAQVIAYLKEHLSSEQFKGMQEAFTRANTISTEIHTRLSAMRTYLNTIGLVDDVHPENSKVFGLITVAPGKGETTIQSMSKYAFLYKELGFRQPIPGNIKNLAFGASNFMTGWEGGDNLYLKTVTNDAESSRVVKPPRSDKDMQAALGVDSIFSMDDNGWFWVLSQKSDSKVHVLDIRKVRQFSGGIDLGVIAARNKDFDALISHNSDYAQALARIYSKTDKDVASSKQWLRDNQVDYDLWNEGLKTPFVLHMLLDKVISQSEKYASEHGKTIDLNSPERAAALDWGQYFTDDFLQ